MAARRPPLNRGHSMPTYPGSQSPSYGPGVETTLSSMACLNLSESSKSGALGTRAGDLMRRGLTTSVSDGSRPPTPIVSRCEQTPDARSQYPTPPYSASPMAYGSHSQQTSYFPSYPPISSSSRSKSLSAQSSSSGGMSSYSPLPSLPLITSPAPNHSSSLLRGRGNSHQQSNVTMTVDSTPHQYILTAPLGHGFSADSITIAARKENVIVVVADRWDQEQDCHHEWQVQFGRDGDMSSVHASFDNGLLKITVKRFHAYGRS